MGTRSDIIVQRKDGKWHRIYCHWDGYLDHNGRILFDHYTTQNQAEKLVALGDLSILGPELGKKHDFNKRMTDDALREKTKNWCTAYRRDRGEPDCHGTVGDTIQSVWPPEDTWTEFTYVWTEGCWWATDPDEGTQTLMNLGDLLMGKHTLKPSVKVFGVPMGRHPAHNPADKPEKVPVAFIKKVTPK